MLDLYTTIHRQVLKNLAFVDNIDCLLTGTTVVFIEFQRVDTYVTGIAINESNKLADHYVAYHNNHTPSILPNYNRQFANLLPLRGVLGKTKKMATL